MLQFKMIQQEEFFDILRKLPKAEIHLHLEDFIAGQAAKEEHVESLSTFVTIFRQVQDSIKYIEDLEIAFRNIVRYMKNNGIVYVEVFFSPGRFLRGGWRYQDLVHFIETQVSGIEKQDGLVIKLICDVSRSYGPEIAEEILEQVIAHRSEDIVGIGLGGDEIIGPARDYVKIFETARRHGLKTVAHAGEAADHQSILDAVELLKAERIGHATSAAQDKNTLALLVKKQIPLEIAPTSNLITGKYVKNLKAHPVRKYLESGAFVTLNSDDPTLFNTSLLNEYWNLYCIMDNCFETLYTILRNGFLASFLTGSKKREHIRNLNRKWNRQMVLRERQKTGPWQNMYRVVFEKSE